MKSNTSIIIGREYLERVRKKSFIITTLLMPLLMLGLMATPALILVFAGEESTTINVVDASGVIAGQFENTEELQFNPVNVPLDSALADLREGVVVYIPADVVKTDAGVKIYSTDPIALSTEATITGQINRAIENERLKEYDIANLAEIMKSVESDVSVQTLRLEEEGEKVSSTGISFAIGEVLNLFLYMALLLYGQMVMTSIIEEKNNRVLELVVSSVKPMQLMIGKILGIGLVAITQILIWLVLMVTMSAFIIPAMLPGEVMAEVSAVGAGTFDASMSTVDPDLVHAMSIVANPFYIIQLFAYLLLFLVGGFLLYAAMFAAIGSSVDNIQDASQLQSIVLFPIILGIVFGMQAASAPNSTLALVMSLIPFTSPMVMMSRIPFGIPGWEIGVSFALLVVSVILMIWLAAKIYRVGIFMYGKKPSFKELLRWARYK